LSDGSIPRESWVVCKTLKYAESISVQNPIKAYSKVRCGLEAVIRPQSGYFFHNFRFTLGSRHLPRLKRLDNNFTTAMISGELLSGEVRHSDEEPSRRLAMAAGLTKSGIE
jgi:hypothetical protein